MTYRDREETTMLNRLFGALAVAVGVGAVIAVKLLKDQKETENNEVEDDDNEVHFITLADGDGVAQPTYDASDRSLEVQEVCGVYPYLNPDFVEELLAEANSTKDIFFVMHVSSSTLSSITSSIRFRFAERT